MKSVFTAIDVDGSGRLDRFEFKDALLQMGVEMTDDECKALFDAMDANRDGGVSSDEFCTVNISMFFVNKRIEPKMNPVQPLLKEPCSQSSQTYRISNYLCSGAASSIEPAGGGGEYPEAPQIRDASALWEEVASCARFVRRHG